MERDLRTELKAVIARALVNETQAGGGAFDDLADAVLDALAYEDVSLVRNYRAAGAQDCGTLAALHNRAATQLEIALTALVKIDRGTKAMREVAGMALLKVALVPYPRLPPASGMEAEGRDAQQLGAKPDSPSAESGAT